MSNAHKHFSLLTQPWIPVRDTGGGATELGILDVLRRAHELRSIGGELPTTSFAITRLLLAILYRSVTGDGDPVDAWRELWRAPELPAELIEEYLSDYADRFDLLDAQAPFYQVAGLVTAGGKVDGLEKLIADVPNGEPFFTTRAGAALAAITFAEAARWVVHAQAFDASGIRSGAIGDDRVKAGKGYPIGTGWVGNIGGVLLEGDTLQQTLLLNLVLAADVEQASSWHPDTDEPAWERAPVGAAVETLDRVPHTVPLGPADLFTWPSRRIRLVHDGKQVTGVVLCNGDPLLPQNLFVEPMTTWRRSEAQEKKLGRQLVYMPRLHVPATSMWRGLAALVPRGIRETQRAGGVRSLPALNLEWLALLRNRGALDGGELVRTRAVGMIYGSNNSVVDDIVDDSLTIHAALFGRGGQLIAERAISAVEATDLAVKQVVNLAGNLVLAAGGEPDGARERARENAYFVVDEPFRHWLSTLDLSFDPVDALFGWFDIARPLLHSLADEMIADASPAAWVGRQITNRTTKNTQIYNTPLADSWFRYRLLEAFPHPEPFDALTPDEQKDSDDSSGEPSSD